MCCLKMSRKLFLSTLAIAIAWPPVPEDCCCAKKVIPGACCARSLVSSRRPRTPSACCQKKATFNEEAAPSSCCCNDRAEFSERPQEQGGTPCRCWHHNRQPFHRQSEALELDGEPQMPTGPADPMFATVWSGPSCLNVGGIRPPLGNKLFVIYSVWLN